MILHRPGCEACHLDSEPCPETYHQLIHDLLDRLETPAGEKMEPPVDVNKRDIEDIELAIESAVSDLNDALYDIRDLLSGRKKKAA